MQLFGHYHGFSCCGCILGALDSAPLFGHCALIWEGVYIGDVVLHLLPVKMISEQTTAVLVAVSKQNKIV